MKGIVKAITAPLSAVGLISKPKVKVPASTPVATRDEARDRIGANRELLRRRGGAADVLFGSGGLEPSPAITFGTPGN